MQLQSQGTLGGELCQRPRCWYFRDNRGLLADRGQDVVEGDNRFHAIFGNAGPAKFVCPSRLAPALIALDARVQIIGPNAADETLMPLEVFYRTPKSEREREYLLEPNQIVSQVILPHPEGRASASYEVRHGAGPEYPLVSAAASILIAARHRDRSPHRAGPGGAHAVDLARSDRRDCRSADQLRDGRSRRRSGRERGHAAVAQRVQGATGQGRRQTRAC